MNAAWDVLRALVVAEVAGLPRLVRLVQRGYTYTGPTLGA